MTLFLIAMASIAWAEAPDPSGSLRVALDGEVLSFLSAEGTSFSSFGVLGGPATYRVGYAASKEHEFGGTVEFELIESTSSFGIAGYYHYNLPAGDHLFFVGGTAGIGTLQDAFIAGDVTQTRIHAESGIKLFVVDHASIDLGGNVGPTIVAANNDSTVAFAFGLFAGLSAWIPVGN